MSVIGSAISRIGRSKIDKYRLRLFTSGSKQDGRHPIGYECAEFGDVDIDKIFIEKFVMLIACAFSSSNNLHNESDPCREVRQCSSPNPTSARVKSTN
jgi:hypothetical protein